MPRASLPTAIPTPRSCTALPRALRSALVLALLCASACAHEVQFLGSEPPETAIRQPLPLVIGVSTQSFEATRINEAGFLEEFTGRLRESRVFEGVIYPLEPGTKTVWELRLLAKDSASEPNSNIWKSALASALFPFAFVIYLQSDYELDLEALLVRNREVVGTYPVKSQIRYRYQSYANTQQMDVEGVQLIVDRSSRELLAKIAADADRIRAEDLARTGK
jgi:hypothetical protein